MTSLDPEEIKRVKIHPVECPKCKLTVEVKPSEKKCPKCQYPLDRPSPEVIEKLKTLYREREHFNRALDRAIAQLGQGEQVSLWVDSEQERYLKQLNEVLTEIGELLLKQKSYKKWLDGDGKGPLPDWIHEVTGGRPGLERIE